eukprot:TRINITY_DN6108_c0_g1_i1.p1 TRINITY_DN6108_c0_g1~~TRINITY_DN6108_c0_g1_i1.p1  ORF type:complete len:326 (+),score=70.66 TRINITY_DN6108_c0_g1_i1:118-1095(+)
MGAFWSEPSPPLKSSNSAQHVYSSHLVGVPSTIPKQDTSSLERHPAPHSSLTSSSSPSQSSASSVSVFSSSSPQVYPSSSHEARAVSTPKSALSKPTYTSTSLNDPKPTGTRDVVLQKYFGSFQCRCGHRWKSAHSWKNETQQCLKCGTKVKPHTLEPKPDKPRSGNNDGKPHRTDLCSMCQKLGRSCTHSMVASVKQEFPNDVMVRGLDPTWSKDKIRQEFSNYGKVLGVKIPRQEASRFQYAFITFENVNEALRRFKFNERYSPDEVEEEVESDDDGSYYDENESYYDENESYYDENEPDYDDEPYYDEDELSYDEGESDYDE